MIPPDFIDDVLARTDIVEIIEPRVALKRTGQNYTGLCPFHTEKSPSFSVSQDKQFYYCFGCQASGSALKFLMEFDRMDFLAAVELLAGRVGLTVPEDRQSGSDESARRRKTIYEILDQAAAVYREELRGHESRDRAVTYLKGRGMSGAVARDFSLGYAPPGWTNLYDKLAQSNYERDLLIESGMVVENAEENKTYDRFRDRIMFPIRDLRGRTIAFGGRVLGDSKPKYLNSPETPVFHKGRELYGLYEARQRNKNLTRLMVVEGYMDVVALAQFGINYAVATLGTATREEHIERLYRLVSQIIFCFDGDPPGTAAAWKALQVVLPFMSDGRSAKFLFVPDGEDPDTLVRKEGREKFELRLDQATALDVFFFSHLAQDLDTSSMEGKAALSKLAIPLINLIPEGVFKQLMIDELATRTGLDAEKLLKVARETKPAVAGRPRDVPVRNDGNTGISLSRRAEAPLAMLARQPELALELDDASYQLLSQVDDCSLLAEIALAVRQHELLSPGLLLGYFHGKPEAKLIRSLIEKEQLLDVSALREEYIDSMNRLLHGLEFQLKQALNYPLFQKPFSELTAEERRQINDLPRKKT